MSNSYDIVVIGSGPGGYVAAIRAAQLKMKTAVIEGYMLGGVCLNWGCIPTKALLKSAEVYEEIKKAKSYGIKVENVSADFPAIIKRSRRVADMNSKGVDLLLKQNNVDVIYGMASFKTNNTVIVESADGKKQEISAKHIIIATGGRPRSIPGIEIDGEKVINSTHAMLLNEVPKSLLVMGAGAIGVEFSYLYATLGTKVTIVEMLDSLLPIEDREITEILANSFKKLGIKVYTSSMVQGLKKTEQGVEVTVSSGDKIEMLQAEKALMAIGIQGNVEKLDLDAVGVKHEKSFVPVDEWYKTNIEGIYAIGDIIGPPLLAHVASHEAITCIDKIAVLQAHKIDYDSVPGCTYCHPQVASIGLTEERALERGHELRIGRFPYSASGKAKAIGSRDGLVKLIFEKTGGKLLGAHIIGTEATELLTELGLAKALGATDLDISRTMHAHPTLSEMIMEAAAAARGEAVHI